MQTNDARATLRRVCNSPVAPRNVGERAELAGRQDRLDVGVPAGLPERFHLVVERVPVAAQNVGARDDDIDLLGTVLYRGFDFGQSLGEGRKPSGEARAHGGNRYRGAFQVAYAVAHVLVVDADGPGMNGPLDAE